MSLQDTVAGAFGAGCCVLAGSPFDVAKARLQHQGAEGAYKGLIHCLTATMKNEGIIGLYRGAWPALGSAIVENSVGITVNRELSRQLKAANGWDLDCRVSPLAEVGLGAVTGVFTSLAICPAEVLKVRQQAVADQSTSTIARDLLRSRGISAMFQGLGSLILRDVPFNALFYGSYESLCTLAMKSAGLRSKDELGSLQVFAAGGMAGAIGWSFVVPMDVIKTRLQTGRSNGALITVLRTIIAEEGWKSLFCGWTAAVTRAFPANAGLFLGVEFASRTMRGLSADR